MSASRLEPAVSGLDSDAAKNAAQALHRYLEGFGLAPGPDREALVARFLAPALRSQPPSQEAEGLSRAVESAERDLAAWFARVLEGALADDQPALLLGRAAFLLCQGGARWPGVLLSEHPPAEFVDALRISMPPPTPPEEQGVMLEQDFESWSLRDLAPSRVARAILGPGGRQAIAS